MAKRLFDIIFAIIGLKILFVPGLIISALIHFTSEGGVFFIQKRVGKNNVDFRIFKFRTMVVDSEKSGQLTVGGKDSRITNIGYILRKLKLDELPQIINVLIGDMSFVGPRPEVRKYVELYTEEQLRVLSVRPGITDLASLEYFEENELLGKSDDPERTYIEEIIPAKLKLNLEYIEKQSLAFDIELILKTIVRIFK